jgi:hypothetical protein
MIFGTMVIAALMLLFAADPIIDNQKAMAANLAGSGLADPDPGISYPSPLSHWLEKFFMMVSTTCIAAPAFTIVISFLFYARSALTSHQQCPPGHSYN